MFVLILRWILTIVLAYIFGKLVSKLKLPSILGWLIAGMVFGPYAFNVLPQAFIDTKGYIIMINSLECFVGLMIGTELVWKKLKSYGKSLFVTTLTQSLGTFVLVTVAFATLI